MKTNGTRCLFLAVLLVSAVSCTSRESASRDSAKDETMFQSATLQSLMIGNYDGTSVWRSFVHAEISVWGRSGVWMVK